jgi:hypothetical protein
MINSLPVPAGLDPGGNGGTRAVAEFDRDAAVLHHGSDCPWIAADPQLRAAATADPSPSLQRDAPDGCSDGDPITAEDHARIEAEIVWLVRRGG